MPSQQMWRWGVPSSLGLQHIQGRGNDKEDTATKIGHVVDALNNTQAQVLIDPRERADTGNVENGCAGELYVEAQYGIQNEPMLGIVQETHVHQASEEGQTTSLETKQDSIWDTQDFSDSAAAERSFRQQIAALLILEFGVIFHSVIIGLNLGVVGSEFTTLYLVLVFHQSVEGLGIGARMSAIPFKRSSWLPWILCMLYGLTTPISIAIGLGLRTTYDPNSNTANIVSGLLDSISAGILIYTGLVELLARDFLFDPCRTNNKKRLAFMTACTVLGAGIMALIGKWA